jgi:hypothetical protein
MGGELNPLKYGGIGHDKARLFAVMDAEQRFILATAGQHNRRIWVDLGGTVVDAEVAERLAQHLEAIRVKTFKLCLVGCSPWGRHRLRKAMRRTDQQLATHTRWFTDPEMAKQWLISERGS